MKSFILGLLFISSLSWANGKPEPVKSEVIQKLICDEITFAYGNEPDEDYYYDNTLASYGINIDRTTCNQMIKTIAKKHYTQLGSRSYATKLELFVSNRDYKCSLNAVRDVTVTLDANDNPVIKKSKWEIDTADKNETCFVRVDFAMLKFDFSTDKEKLTKLSNEEVSTLNLFSPEYLQLGEPDDGAVGTFETYYSYKVKGKLIGYINEYWYANSEGEWATVYILKYNAQGKFLGNLIEDYSADYCEYPGFEPESDLVLDCLK